MGENDVWAREMYCIICKTRFNSEHRPTLLYCRHLQCRDCGSDPSLCNICGDLRNYHIKPEDPELLKTVMRAGDMYDRLETMKSGSDRTALVQTLERMILNVDQQLNFEKVECRFGQNCKIPGCMYNHSILIPAHLPPAPTTAPISLPQSYDSNHQSSQEEIKFETEELEDGVPVELVQDKCERCGEAEKDMLPFCVYCGFAKEIIAGKSFPDPLKREREDM